MKLFDDMSPVEKLDHIERSMAQSKIDVLEVTCLADILDVWDYWAPYLIQRLRKLEAVAESAQRFEAVSHDYPEQKNFWVSDQKAFLNSQAELADALKSAGYLGEKP